MYGVNDTPYGEWRWGALLLLCLAQLMVFLDATVVNVALPTIEQRLHFSRASLSWVVNAYLLGLGGFLLLAGRTGDVFGRRRTFLAGIAGFTAASLGCALAKSQTALIVGRGTQGVAAALVSATGLSMIVTLFSDPDDRIRATGVFGVVATGGGTLGVIVGGVLTRTAGWQSIFLLNVPVGTALLALGRWLPASGPAALERGRRAALIPLRILRTREVAVANALAALLRAAMFSWFFFAALYMQQALGFSALAVGLGFLPATVAIGATSYWLAGAIVRRYGIRVPFVAGAALVAIGLVTLAPAPAGGAFMTNVLPGMLLLGVGGGLLFVPLILTATSFVAVQDAGVASGLLSTSQQLGGALGLAVLSALPSFRAGFLAGAALAAIAAALGLALLPRRPG